MTQKPLGFSLLELLVVLVIIGIVLTVALFALGNTAKNQRIQNAGERLVNLLPIVEEQAILEPNVYGLVINAMGYGFERIVIKNGKKQWVAVTNNSLLAFRPWPSGTQIQLQISKEDASPITGPNIIISPSGDLTAFSLVLGNEKPLVIIQASESGTVVQKNL